MDRPDLANAFVMFAWTCWRVANNEQVPMFLGQLMFVRNGALDDYLDDLMFINGDGCKLNMRAIHSRPDTYSA